MNKLKITFLTPMLKKSGGNTVLFKYAEYLANQGHKVYIIAPADKKQDYIENDINIKTFKKIPNKYFEHIFFQLIYIKKFCDLIPFSDVIIPVFFPLIIHSIYAKIKGKTSKIIPPTQNIGIDDKVKADINETISI